MPVAASLLTLLVSSWLRSRERREDDEIALRRRWDEQKREVYVDFLGALARLRRAGQEEEFAKKKLAEVGDDEELRSLVRAEVIKAKESWIAAHDSAMTQLTQIAILSPSFMESLGLEATNLAAVANASADVYPLMRARFVQLASADLQIPDEKK